MPIKFGTHSCHCHICDNYRFVLCLQNEKYFISDDIGKNKLLFPVPPTPCVYTHIISTTFNAEVKHNNICGYVYDQVYASGLHTLLNSHKLQLSPNATSLLVSFLFETYAVKIFKTLKVNYCKLH